ncbi:hypothetical protein D9M72_272140 [compost metagenome]
MGLGQGARQYRVAIDQRFENGAVFLFDHAHVAATGRFHPQELADFRLQAHLGMGQAQRLGGGGHFDMESRIGTVPRQARGGLLQRFDVLGDARLLLAGTALGSQACRGAGNRHLLVAEVAQVRAAHVPQALQQQRFGQLHRRADETAAVAPPASLDQPALAQHHQRLAQGHRRHAQLQGQLAFTGQLLALGEQSQLDCLHQPARHLVGAAFLAQTDECGAAGSIQGTQSTLPNSVCSTRPWGNGLNVQFRIL